VTALAHAANTVFLYIQGTISPRRLRHFVAAASHILSSRSPPFSRRAAAAAATATAASHICVTAATPYFLANNKFSRTEATKCHFNNAITIVRLVNY
jgi:hypothetical protein